VGGESTAGGTPGRPPAMERGYARSRKKTDEARAALKPLAPGERPTAVTVAAIVALLIAVTNVVLFYSGWEVQGQEPSTSGTWVFVAIMLTAAVGMWRGKYWAVLGFEMLLGIAIIGTAAALLRASNLAAVALCFGIFAVCGPLFWFLIRAMARLQMPTRTR